MRLPLLPRLLLSQHREDLRESVGGQPVLLTGPDEGTISSDDMKTMPSLSLVSASKMMPDLGLAVGRNGLKQDVNYLD